MNTKNFEEGCEFALLREIEETEREKAFWARQERLARELGEEEWAIINDIHETEVEKDIYAIIDAIDNAQKNNGLSMRAIMNKIY